MIPVIAVFNLINFLKRHEMQKFKNYVEYLIYLISAHLNGKVYLPFRKKIK